MAGHDFRFGHRNAGTPALLMKKAAQLGMGCDIIPAVTLDGKTVSSTHIRALLQSGEMAEAARFLGKAAIFCLRMDRSEMKSRAGQSISANI